MTQAPLTGRGALEAAHRTLADAGLPSPASDARWLLSHVTGRSLGGLDLVTLTEAEHDAFQTVVARRAAGEPVQHITGTAPFRYLELAVGPGVFIPRPETEQVVEHALGLLRAMGPTPFVVDLGTGSGAIAAAIATETDARVVAVEKSVEAAVWAAQNLAGTGVTLVRGDLADALPELDGQVDLVISNPPYIPAGHAGELPADVVGHDPHLALFGGADGLDVVRAVVATAHRLLRPGGWLVIEHDDTHGSSAQALVAAHGGFTDIADHDDLTGRPRFVTARRAPRVPE